MMSMMTPDTEPAAGRRVYRSLCAFRAKALNEPLKAAADCSPGRKPGVSNQECTASPEGAKDDV
jgi:hypothetical protein